jgi:cytochrome d ubiquinol oxidase subunit I
MSSLSPLLLSRLQFAWVVSLHILLPAFTVGLSCFVATLEVLWWATKRDVYRRLSAFWIKIFAVSFGMGVVSGIVMPFQFGTNWSRYSDVTGNVVGSLMAYESLTAFFLESAFLGVLLFGRKLVPQWAHVFSAVMVAVGTLISSFWILAVNSWMQTPQGFHAENGRFYPDSIAAIIFSPSFPYRLAHNVTAFLITTAFVVLGVGAWYRRLKRAPEESRVMIKMGLFFLIIAVPVQMVLGDMHGLNTLKYQPTKIAAMEGLWESGSSISANLFSIPDQDAEKNHFEVAIPHLGSLYLTHNFNGYVRGLKEWPREDRPPVAVVFFAFRVMVGMGMLMLFTVITGIVLLLRKRVFDSPRYLRWCIMISPIGFLAVLGGWVTTEAGRQPWTVYGHLRTADSVTPSLTGGDVLTSITLYILAYIVIFGAGIILLVRLVRVGPLTHEPERVEQSEARAARPLSAVSATGQHPDTQFRGANDA